MLSSSVIFSQCSVFLTVLILFPTVVFQHLSKVLAYTVLVD